MHDLEKKKAHTKAWISSRPGYARAWHLKREYGLTIAAYEVMLTGQGGGCAVCHQKPGKQALQVDHDHQTGKVRGILCGPCNRALGIMNDDLARLRRLTEYLERNQ